MTEITTARLHCLFLAKVAEQAERYRDVITQLKIIIHDNNANLTFDERNLLSVAYKNLTATHRASWRTIDGLETQNGRKVHPREVKLMHYEKGVIEKDLEAICKDLVDLLEGLLIPAADPGEPTVFYCKMRGDYYRYLAELSKAKPGDKLAKESFEAYKTAYWHALTTLEPTHPTRLGLALNFAVYFHDVMKSPERACHLAKHALDEAVAYATDPETAPGNIEDSVMILQLIKDDLLLWHEEMKRDASE